MTENLMNKTIGELLSDPRIARIAPDAIRGRDLPHDPLWGKTLTEIRDEKLLTGDIAPGFERLYRAADSGEWYYPLDDEERGANLLWFPSDDPKADGRPFILVAAGGGFVSVWSMTEAWPVAARFNRLGYHAFILTYHVDERENLLRTDMEDFARALRFIRANRERFRVDGESYITCGFSAGGYLVCLCLGISGIQHLFRVGRNQYPRCFMLTLFLTLVLFRCGFTTKVTHVITCQQTLVVDIQQHRKTGIGVHFMRTLIVGRGSRTDMYVLQRTYTSGFHHRIGRTDHRLRKLCVLSAFKTFYRVGKIQTNFGLRTVIHQCRFVLFQYLCLHRAQRQNCGENNKNSFHIFHSFIHSFIHSLQIPHASLA